MKKYSLSHIIALCAFLALPVASYAISRGDFAADRKKTHQEIQDKRNQLKEELHEKRDALKQQFERGRAELRGMKQHGAATSTMREEYEKFMQEMMAKRTKVREELKENREDFKNFEKERKDALKKKFGELKSTRIEQFFERMVEKFNRAFSRLKELSDRIAKRLDEAAANGRDVRKERQLLGHANDKINDAERALEEAKSKFTDAAKEPDFRLAFAKVQELVHGVAAALREAHQSLIDVVRSLKGEGENREHARTTP